MEIPEVQYVMTDDGLRIAYQVFGSGPPSVFVPAAMTHLEALWEPGLLTRVWERTAANLRVALFDHRGSGLSDGFQQPPSLTERALDVKAVMTATGMERASLMGNEFGAQVAVAFAAEYPDRVDRLVLVNGRVGQSARPMAEELNPGVTDPGPRALSKDNLASLNRVGIEVDEHALYFCPSLARHPDVLEWTVRLGRMAGSRSALMRQVESVAETDIVAIAQNVEAPTLIIHTIGNRLHHVGYARYLAQLMPNASLLEIPGDDQWYWIAENWKEYVDAGIRFITNTAVDAPTDRRFAVVMFTDIVGSTAISVDSGDAEWRSRLELHDRVSQRVVTQHGGSLIKNTGDGILAIFGMPSRAIDAALELNQNLRKSNIAIRTGLHAGEIEVRGKDISGATVNLAARVQHVAADGRVYTTATIRDMLIGSPYRFDDAGRQSFKGFEGNWQLFKVSSD
jgi:class 3 adenylate cyclase/pimeloyl-ACP methyl ester carboxylesterase